MSKTCSYSPCVPRTEATRAVNQIYIFVLPSMRITGKLHGMYAALVYPWRRPHLYNEQKFTALSTRVIEVRIVHEIALNVLQKAAIQKQFVSVHTK